MPTATPEAARTLAEELRQVLDGMPAVAEAPRPGHRVKLHWPPHPISREYHVVASDWTDRAEFEAYGERFSVLVAHTPHGVFGRTEDLWNEARGESVETMLQRLRQEAEPLFRRQMAAAHALGQTGRFIGHVRDLAPLELLKLLFCEDRDVAHEAMTEIETHASTGMFFPSLLVILGETRHPMRRSAQWCVLDLFEGLPSFAPTEADQMQAVEAMRALIWDAQDDDCRAIYKAGVVLGGHVFPNLGGPALLSCLSAPSRIGRRSAMHGLYHVVEWGPDMKDIVVWALSGAANSDPEPVLRRYAADMARDIAAGADHVPDPVLPGEQ